MSQATLAWAAFKNMLRTAARDPLWAFVALLSTPFRIWKPLLGALFILIITLFVIGMGGRFFLENMGFGPGSVPFIALDLVTLLVLAAIVFRFITNPLILHFGDMEGETHGSARFATNKEVAPLTRADSGLLIGRDGKTGKLLRYDGPAHLLTMAQTRTGKGVGTIIPNLLTADRSVICIDPKGENASIAGRARQQFGPVHVLDPFGVTGMTSAAFNPLAMLDPDSLDVAEDASTLADALVFEEPGMEPGQLDPVNGLRSPQGNHQLLDPIKNAIVIGKPAYMIGPIVQRRALNGNPTLGCQCPDDRFDRLRRHGLLSAGTAVAPGRPALII